MPTTTPLATTAAMASQRMTALRARVIILGSDATCFHAKKKKCCNGAMIGISTMMAIGAQVLVVALLVIGAVWLLAQKWTLMAITNVRNENKFEKRCF